MGPVYLFDLASSHARWLSLRQAAISSNVANANTPGYKAKDIEPFSKLLDAKVVSLAVTNPKHLATEFDLVASARDTQRGQLGSRPLRQFRQPGAGNDEGR